MRSIGVIDYGSGNLHSTFKAVERVARELGSKNQVKFVTDAAEVPTLSHIILPGVGAYADCYRGLQDTEGMLEALETAVHSKKIPFLGICVGMQLLAEYGEEHGKHQGLGWITGKVTAIKPAEKSFKIPHVGWNNLTALAKHPLLNEIHEGDHAYFVHSYHFKVKKSAEAIAFTNYGEPITAVVAKGNIMGAQFHPEKSQQTGLTLLRNFLLL